MNNCIDGKIQNLLNVAPGKISTSGFKSRLSIAIAYASLSTLGCVSEINDQSSVKTSNEKPETSLTIVDRQRSDENVGIKANKLPSEKKPLGENVPMSSPATRGEARLTHESEVADHSSSQPFAKQKFSRVTPVQNWQVHKKDYYTPVYNTEKYKYRAENGIKLVADEPISTFSIDVDTASYSVIRRMLQAGTLPRPDAVRVEELINYFNYDYKNPESTQEPFSVHTEIAPSPWSKGKHLLHIGLQGYDLDRNELPASNLVFLVDVSGSMRQPNKLPLLKTSLKMLSRQLSGKDKISIVVYAGAAGVVLEPVQANNTRAISHALDCLQAGGSTNGGAGIELAYSLAERSFIEGGINRVILATDGDFNVGISDHESLKRLVESKRKTGIFLTTLGFGTGNYNDMLMNELAETGNGNSAYIDTALEARKVLVDEVSSTLMTIAKDVKIQIEFSPRVAEYRLIGYESRLLNREDFNNDSKDAGEIGAGHSVTAIYEITLTDSHHRHLDPLRYHRQQQPADEETGYHDEELAFLKLRYKLPDENKSRLISQPLYTRDIKDNLGYTSDDFRFSTAIVGFAQLLKQSAYVNQYGFADIELMAKQAKGKDNYGYRSEFIKLVKMADSLKMAHSSAPRPFIAQETTLR